MKSASAAASARVPPAATSPKTLASDKIGRWLKTTGFIQYGKREAVHINRLTANKTEAACIQWVIGHTRSVTRAKGRPAKQETEPISTEEFQEFAHANLRTTQEALQRLCETTKILLRRPALKKELAPGIQSVRGWYVYSLPAIEIWEKLPAWEPEKADKKPVDSSETIDGSEVDADEPQDEPEVQRAQPRSNVKIRIIEKPMRIPRGRWATDVPPEAGAGEKFEFVNRNLEQEVEVDLISLRCGVTRIVLQKWSGSSAPTRVENGSDVANTAVANALAARSAPVLAAISGLANAVSDRFGLLMEAGLRAKLRASDEDWERARVWFSGYDIEFQMMLVADIESRIGTGEFGRPRFAPKLWAYIDERRWTWPAWEKGDGRSQKQREMDEQYDRGLAWAQSVDVKMRGHK